MWRLGVKYLPPIGPMNRVNIFGCSVSGSTMASVLVTAPCDVKRGENWLEYSLSCKEYSIHNVMNSPTAVVLPYTFIL